MSGWALRVGLERAEIVLQPGDESDVLDRLLGAGRVEQVLEHAPVDVDVLGLGRAALPGREEDVRRGGAAHGCGDRAGVQQIGGQRG